MAILSSETVHASTVAIDGRAVMIMGASGSGKSDLALRLLDRGAVLVSDDYTLVKRSGTGLIATAPAHIAGRIEVRGVGILTMPHVADVPVALIVAVDRRPTRLPERETRVLAGVSVPVVALSGFEASAAIKVARALDLFGIPL